MIRIVHWASLVFACIYAALMGPCASAQQTLTAAATTESELRQKCLRWFNASYAGTLKNATYYYRFGRRVVYTFSTTGQIVQVGGQPVCDVTMRWETDARDSGTLTSFYIDGKVATWHKETDHRVWTSFTSQGRCLWRQGRMVTSGFGPPLEGTLIYSSGEGAFCRE